MQENWIKQEKIGRSQLKCLPLESSYFYKAFFIFADNIHILERSLDYDINTKNHAQPSIQAQGKQPTMV